MGTNIDHSTYISPFTWRYGTDQMRYIWSEVNKRRLLRKVWVALAKAQSEAGLVKQEQVDDLIAHQDEIDIERATQIESEIHHDLMAEIKTYAEQCPIGGPIIHLGATSMDVLDNVDALRQKEALTIIIKQVENLLKHFANRIEESAHLASMAFTHIQPAEPTTVGYRLAQTAQDLLEDLKELRNLVTSLKGKGMKGAVGTGASYETLLEEAPFDAITLEKKVMEALDLECFTVATQVYSRKQDLKIGTVLASLSATLSKFALDMRILQSPPIGEFAEPFATKQVGSSAMPFKRNPIIAEKIDSLCRLVNAQTEVLWQNVATNILERTLDDSANRRVVMPILFLASEEILKSAIRLVEKGTFKEYAINSNLQKYGIFAATERLMMVLGRKGADRQEMHELIRTYSLKAWEEVQNGQENSLNEKLVADKTILSYLTKDEIKELLDASHYTGNAAKLALALKQEIEETLNLSDLASR
jgi:adenylosuccinate lyase